MFFYLLICPSLCLADNLHHALPQVTPSDARYQNANPNARAEVEKFSEALMGIGQRTTEGAEEILLLLDEFKEKVQGDVEDKMFVEEEATRKEINNKYDSIKKATAFAKIFIKNKSEEVKKLKTRFEEAEVLKLKKFEELVNLDIMRAQVVRECEESDEVLEQLTEKTQQLQEIVPVKIREYKEEVGKLKQDIESLENKKVHQNNEAKKQKMDKVVTAGPNLPLLEYITRQIKSKEEELECPVCFEVASSPIFMCSEDHLVCSVCRPLVSQCPECREVYTGFRRHRFAEKAAVELEGLFRERAKVLGD